MFITNDVSLITFVPFGILILKMGQMESRICYLTVLMTIAANLGSMFTPIGNPQNLYLYSLSGMSLPEFLWLMLPFTAHLRPCFWLSFPSLEQNADQFSIQVGKSSFPGRKDLLFFGILFLFCLCSVAGFLQDRALLILVAAPLFFRKRNLFAKIDYALLFDFCILFYFCGKYRSFESLRIFIRSVLENHERPVSNSPQARSSAMFRLPCCSRNTHPVFPS